MAWTRSKKSAKKNNKKFHIRKGKNGLNAEKKTIQRSNLLLSNRMVIAPRFFTKIRTLYTGCMLTGFLPAGGATDFQFTANQLVQPFSFASHQITTPFPPQNGSGSTQNYNGYTFLNNAYSMYRIHGCKITLKITCVNSGDIMNVWMYPICQTSTVNPPPLLLKQAIGIPFVKQVMCTNSSKVTTLTSFIPMRKVLGLSKNQYNDYPATAWNAVIAAQNQVQIWTQFATVDGLTNAGQILLDYEVESFIECCNPQIIIN